jgi:hypothetical protein
MCPDYGFKLLYKDKGNLSFIKGTFLSTSVSLLPIYSPETHIQVRVQDKVAFDN